MLHILWVILKIIGIVLLVLLALILVLLLLVLFIPIRYKITGEVYEETKAKGTASWLCHLFAISFQYELKQLKVFLRILGIPFRIPITQEEKEKRNQKRIRRDGRARRKETKKETRRKKKMAKAESNVKNQRKKHKKNKDLKNIEKTNSEYEIEILKNENKSLDNANDLKDEDSKTSFQEKGFQDNNQEKNREKKKKGFWERLKEIFKKVKYTIISICAKLKDIKNTWNEIRSVWKDEKVKLAITQLKNQTLYFIKHCKPKKFKMEIYFGLEDPAVTGQILGGISMFFYPLYHKNISVVPNFEHEILKAMLLAKGKIRIFTVLRILLRLYRDKNIKYALRRLQRTKQHDNLN